MKNRKEEIEYSHSEDLQDIITRPPSWLLRQGIGFVVLSVVILISLSAFIRYPETVKGNLKINAINAPKKVMTKVSGNLVEILVEEGREVVYGEHLGYMESTAKHRHVLQILETLFSIRDSEDVSLDLNKLLSITSPNNLKLGELQNSYQDFYQSYLSYLATIEDGIYLKKRNILLKELENIKAQGKHIEMSFDLLKKELNISVQEYEKFKVLAEKKVISPLELQKQEALLLSKKQSVPQAENNILALNANILGLQRELSELDNSIKEEKKKFVQSMNSLISEAEDWKKQYVISAPTEGRLIYSGTLQKNQFLESGIEVFYVNPPNASYFGEMYISQNSFGRIKVNQDVQVKVHSFPYEEYGYIKGKVTSITDIPIRDSVFLARIELIRSPKDSLIRLKPGILADADVITDDRSVLERIWFNILKSVRL